MRLAGIMLVLVVGLGARAGADDKALAAHAGKVVLSPDKPPATLDELPGYLAANTSEDKSYTLTGGPPWTLHVTSVLAKPAKDARIVFAEKGVWKMANDVKPAARKVVMSRAELTIAAGFRADATYEVRIKIGTRIVARSTLVLRD